MLNKAQTILVNTYGDGDYLHITDAAQADMVGDTLFTFLMRELDDDEGCDSVETASDRVRTAIAQLMEVADALEEADDGAERWLTTTSSPWSRSAPDT